MPHYNREALLVDTIKSYERLYADLELCICDDRSEPEPFWPETRFEVKMRHIFGTPEPRNPCKPINYAVSLATNDIIVITNPETAHRDDVFTEMRKSLQYGNDYVIAACKNDKTGRWHTHSSKTYDHPMPEGAGFHHCVMFYRQLWDKAGGFDEDYRLGHAFDDNDWVWRLHKAGANFILRDDLVVWHTPTHVKWDRSNSNEEMFYRKWNPYWQTL